MKVCLDCGNRFAESDWQCIRCGQQPIRAEFWTFAPDLDGQDDFIEADSFERLAKLESGSFWFRARNELIGWALHRYAPHTKSFMEIGCGTGFVLAGVQRAFPTIELTGADVHQSGLRFARGRVPGANLLQLDARRLPFDSEFDAVGAFDVLEHIDEDVQVLGEMGQAVKPGGTILVSVPQHELLWSAADDYAHHRRRYERREIRAKLHAAGLEVVSIVSFVSILLPLLVASRIRQRGSVATYDPTAELKVSPTLDRALETVMRLERWLIRGSVRFPAGGSLMAVARRPINGSAPGPGSGTQAAVRDSGAPQ